jgi:hypothetical protein
LKKENDVYIPLLQAFIDEIKQSYAENGAVIPHKILGVNKTGFSCFVKKNR